MMASLLTRTLALTFVCSGLTVFLSTRTRCLFVVLSAAAVIEVADLTAIKQGFLEHRIDLIVYKATPARGGIP